MKDKKPANPFLKKLFQYVASNLEDELVWIVDGLADLFRSVNVANLMRDYRRTGQTTSTSRPAKAKLPATRY